MPDSPTPARHRPDRSRSSSAILSALVATLLTGCLVLLAACRVGPAARTVVVYTSVDQVYSEPILKRFEEKSGIRVLPVYDVEATKTTGLVNRLIAEKGRPQADLFWNGEFAQTLLLKDEGVLAPYRSAAAGDLPTHYVDPEGYWTGLAGRARVLLVNTGRISPADAPRSLDDLLLPAWPGDQIGIAYPMFGTAATHAAALYAAWGPERAKAWHAQLKSRGVHVVDGNSVVRDLVSSGQLMMGLVDTDDACGALKKGAPVALVFLDQGETGLGTLVIPGTVALVAGAPHPREAQALLDFLASKEVEGELVAAGWSQIPLRPVSVQPACTAPAGGRTTPTKQVQNTAPLPGQVKGMAVSLADTYRELELAKTELGDLFIR
jgi:iron(III) transport system substrate-binding protein